MKVELHLHTSRYSTCAVAGPEELIDALVAQRYDAVYITEHNRFWTAEEIGELQEWFPDIRIFPGAELSAPHDGFQHILVLGTTDASYLELPSAAMILDQARRQGHLTVMAHPCRYEDASAILDEGLRTDALEHSTCNQEFTAAAAAQDLSERLDIPMVNAGDVHSVAMVGRHWIETADPIGSADDIRRIVLSGRYENRSRHTRMFR